MLRAPRHLSSASSGCIAGWRPTNCSRSTGRPSTWMPHRRDHGRRVDHDHIRPLRALVSRQRCRFPGVLRLWGGLDNRRPGSTRSVGSNPIPFTTTAGCANQRIRPLCRAILGRRGRRTANKNPYVCGRPGRVGSEPVADSGRFGSETVQIGDDTSSSSESLARDRPLERVERDPNHFQPAAARCSRSRSRRRRSSRSASDNRSFVLDMTAPFRSAPPAAGQDRPQRNRTGAKLRRWPTRAGRISP
jgi:hypothetical protein